VCDGQLFHGIEDKMHDVTGGHLFGSAHSPDPSTLLRVQTIPEDHTAETSVSGDLSRFCWPAERSGMLLRRPSAKKVFPDKELSSYISVSGPNGVRRLFSSMEGRSPTGCC
jgi:hypothetical protein